MSTMEAISLTTAPANASEIALGKDVDLEERRHLQDLGLPLHHHLLSQILLYSHRGPLRGPHSPLARSTERPAAPFR